MIANANRHWSLLCTNAAAAALVAGCSGVTLTQRDPSFAKTTATAVDWNPAHANVGKVIAVAEVGDEVDVFSDTGVYIFVSGSLVGSDASVTRWVGASAIPASDGGGRWVVGFDDSGALWRVKDRSHLERVGDRFALPKKAVLAAFGASTPSSTTSPGGAASLSPPQQQHLAGFLLDDQLALADGKQVRFVASHALGAAGGGTVVALRHGDSVTKLSADLKTATAYPLKGVDELAVDGSGHVFAARDDGVYAESGAHLVLVYRASSGKIRGLAASGEHGERIWLSEGGQLAAIDSSGGGPHVVTVATAARAPMSASARLFGSPSGDVWIVDSGQLARYSVNSGQASTAANVGNAASAGKSAAAPSDDASWQATVRPIFLRVCASCHAPGGSSGVDLSSSAVWRSSRAEIRSRVVDARSMPPAGAPHPLTDTDRTALASWLTR